MREGPYTSLYGIHQKTQTDDYDYYSKMDYNDASLNDKLHILDWAHNNAGMLDLSLAKEE